MSCHVVISDEQLSRNLVLAEIKELARERFRIDHTTVQIEELGPAESVLDSCDCHFGAWDSSEVTDMLQFGTLILTALLLQARRQSLDSSSPKERIDAVERLSLTGARRTLRPSPRHLKKEPKSDVRAAMVAGLGRIGVPEVIPVLTQSLQTDLDKDVRLQVVDSFQRLYIPVE